MHGPVKTLAPPVLVAAVVGVFFALCFGGALHSPRPHGMDLAVVGPPPVVQQFQRVLDQKSPGAFDVHVAGSAAAARSEVLRRSVAGAFIANPARPTLLVAGAGGLVTRNLLTEIFGAATSATGHPLAIDDVRPAPSGDGAGLSPFLLTVSVLIPSILLAGLLAATSPRTSPRQRLTAAIVGAVAVGFLAAWLVDGVFGAMPGHYFALAGVVTLLSLAAVLPALAAHRMLGLPGIGLAALLFVVLGMPATGAALGPAFLPGFFRGVSAVFPAGEAVPVLRNVAYFPMAPVATELWALGGWALAGAVILGLPALRRSDRGTAVRAPGRLDDRLAAA